MIKLKSIGNISKKDNSDSKTSEVTLYYNEPINPVTNNFFSDTAVFLE